MFWRLNKKFMFSDQLQFNYNMAEQKLARIRELIKDYKPMKELSENFNPGDASGGNYKDIKLYGIVNDCYDMCYEHGERGLAEKIRQTLNQSSIYS